jgi:two-component system phosphate regulon response regulator PhoB
MTPLILVVEDEPPQVELLRYNLEKEGFRAIAAGDGEEAMARIAEETPDLVILDWMLPNLSGLEVCRQLRARPETRQLPVLMLTARGEASDRVRGLELGADDYVVKPFSPSEVIARVRALLRRARPSLAEDSLEFNGVVIDLVAHRVSRDGASIHLGPKEYDLLATLMERPGRVFSRERLLDLVWGRDIHVEARSVDVAVRRLRQALNQSGAPDLIRTVRGAGYAIDTDAR